MQVFLHRFFFESGYTVLHFCCLQFLALSSHGGGGGGGEGGAGGAGGGDGGWNCTTKDLVPLLPSSKEKLCPKPGAAHSAPFQPSPYEYE